MLIIKNSKEVDIDFIDKIMELDAKSYNNMYCGTKESIMARYNKNGESCLLLMDNDKIVGYLYFFPINEQFTQTIYNSNTIFDDNISPDDICQYTKDEKLNIYIISICIDASVRGGGGVGMLMRNMIKFIKDKQSNGIKIGKIIAAATSEKGRFTLAKSGFKTAKECGDFTLMEVDTHAINFRIKSDICIFSQCIKDDSASSENCSDWCLCGANGRYDEEDFYTKALTETTKYEFNEGIAQYLKRRYLGSISLVIKTDTNIHVDCKPIEGRLYMTQFNDVYVMNILLEDIECDPTLILDQASADTLCVIYEGQEINYNQYLKKFGLKKLGTNRNCITLNEKADKEYLAYLLAGEAYISDYLDSTITSRYYLEKATENIAQYSMSDIYASDRNVVEILNNPSKNFAERFEYEKLIIFIMEMISLQICTIESTNNAIICAITDYKTEEAGGRPVKIEMGINEFGQNFLLWNLHYYKYSISNNLHCHIEKAFDISHIKQSYETSNATLLSLIAANNEKKRKKQSGRINLLFLLFTLMSALNTIEVFLSKFLSLADSQNIKTISWASSLVLWLLAFIVFLTLQFDIRERVKKYFKRIKNKHKKHKNN